MTRLPRRRARLAGLASVVLGAGRPLLPRRLDLKLLEQERNGDLLVARYGVRGPRAD